MNNQEITINIMVDESKNTISLDGFAESNTIDVRGDVDFTKLVESLERLIDESREIKINPPKNPISDEKIQLVVNTIIEVLNAYNASIRPNEVAEESINEAQDQEVTANSVEEIF